MVNKVVETWHAIWKHYATLKIISVCLLLYIAAFSYAPIGFFGQYGGFTTITSHGAWVIDPNNPENTAVGLILTKGSYRPIVAENVLQMFCLGVTRASAFFMYPSLIMVFTTKFRATMEIIMRSPLMMYTYDDLHELHIYCGWVVVLDGLVHALFHIIRWTSHGNMWLFFGTRTGLSGFVITVCTVIIGFPMMFEPLRKRMQYEVRKGLHYFFIVFCIAMSFHAPLSTIPNGGFAPILFPVIILWYMFDNLYVNLFMTEKIESTIFHVVPTGVQLTMTVSARFQSWAGSGGYCYVNFPWISKREWHAFSLFENPADPNERQIYIQDLGNWTHAILKALQRDTRRPIWVSGPFSSPYDNAVDTDNQILVAGGIGITPAISVMRKHKDTRRSNLIWACRDPHMLEFFVKHGEFSNRGWNLIFYTGKQPLYTGDAHEIMTSTGAVVHIIRARPNFDSLIPNIIYSIESGEFVPEAFISDLKMDAINQLQEKLKELDQSDLASRDKMTELINFSDDLGFLFSDLMSEVAGASSQNDDDDNDVENHLKNVNSAGLKNAPEEGKMLGMIRMASTVDMITGGAEAEGGAAAKHKARMSVARTSMMHGHGKPTTLHKRGEPRQSTMGMAWGAFDNTLSDFQDEVEVFKPWLNDAEEAQGFVKGLDRDTVLSTWGCLYCGGQGPLANNLRKTTKEMGLSLNIESFKW